MKKILIALGIIIVLAVLYKQSQSGGISLPFMRVHMVNPLPQSSALYQQHQAFVDKFNSKRNASTWCADFTAQTNYRGK